MVALAIIAVAAIVIGIAAQQWQSNSGGSENGSKEFSKLVLLPTPRALPNINLVDHHGNAVNTSELSGHWHILFFGFTNCPDVCPSTLHALKQAKQALSDKGVWGQTQVRMVSVDPKRDTPERLARYVPYFDESFVGLTGELDALTEFSKKVGILFIARDENEFGGYDVDHSASLILINPQGQYAGVITVPHSNEELISDLAQLFDQQSSAAAHQDEVESSIEINNAWIRPAPPTADALAGYMSISNKGAQAIKVVSATSPMFEEVMIHSTVVQDGIASMQHIGHIEIEPESTVELAPMGTHLMLIEPETPLELNSIVPITLELSNGDTVQHLFEVKQP